MTTSSDTEYRNTKLIKQGKTTLDESFTILADLIKKKFGVKPINFHYDVLTHNNTPRLQVIFERRIDAKVFHSKKKLLFFKMDKEKIIANLFHKVFGYKYRTDNLYVIYGTFENIAKEEANLNVPEKLINDLKNKYVPQDLWEIRKTFASAIFFFLTDEEAKSVSESHLKKELRDEYFNLVKQFDEFNYLGKNEFEIGFDSKENFVNNYQSNWFYYHKDH
jgi:hypothetical protein